MPLTGGGFSFALAFSRSMTTSWLVERQGKERGVAEGSGTGRPVGRGVWGRAGSSDVPGQLSLLLRRPVTALQQVQPARSLGLHSTKATTGQGSGWPWMTQVQTLN